MRDAIQVELASAGESSGGRPRRVARSQSARSSGGSGKYSRLEAEVAAMQRDSGTYCDEPEDAEQFGAWLEGFDLAARRPDVERLIAGNTFMAELQVRGRLVAPGEWT